MIDDKGASSIDLRVVPPRLVVELPLMLLFANFFLPDGFLFEIMLFCLIGSIVEYLSDAILLSTRIFGAAWVENGRVSKEFLIENTSWSWSFTEMTLKESFPYSVFLVWYPYPEELNLPKFYLKLNVFRIRGSALLLRSTRCVKFRK